MRRRSWTRQETLIAFNLYCRTPFGRLHARNPEIISVAPALGRTPSALAMKCCNLAAFDHALHARGISGLRKASQLDEQVWREFKNDPEKVAFEAELAYSALLKQEIRYSETVEWEDVQGLDKAMITKVRVNQHFFRSIVLAGYRMRCAVCELPVPSLLVAAHIIPWCIDKSLRMNPHNGICFCTLHDRAFDKGLIHIQRDYKISIRPELHALARIPVVEATFLKFEGRLLVLPDRWLPDPMLLERHGCLIQCTRDELQWPQTVRDRAGSRQ